MQPFPGGPFPGGDDAMRRWIEQQEPTKSGRTRLTPMAPPLPVPVPKTVTPPAPKSRKCTDAEVEKLNRDMHRFYNRPRTCSMQGDTCASATAKVAANNGAIAGRVRLQQKCFAKGDPNYEEHMKKISEITVTLKECEAVMMAKCI